MPGKNEICSVDIMDDEDLGEVIGFDDDLRDLGTVVNTFSLGINDDNNSKDFGTSNLDKKILTNNNPNDLDTKTLKPKIIYSNNLDTKTLNYDNSSPKGLTTPIDGELFNIKRSYQFRESTLRKLTELKVKDSDINIYLNQILDKAICFYHDYVVNKKS